MPKQQPFHLAAFDNFLGHSPIWYKQTIFAFLVFNPFILLTFEKFFTGWIFVAEFIFTLAMALKCYPLQPGGLLAIEAILLGMTNTESVKHEVFQNFPVILLLIFMVAGIYFMKNLLLFVFTKILLGVKSKALLSFLFCLSSAVLSAFLDALTVTAVIISVATGFYAVYHKVASGKKYNHPHDHGGDEEIQELHRADLDGFRALLRSLLMHAAVGTALGGVCTTVGEPQNLLIAGKAGWDFVEFFNRMAPVTMVTLVFGLSTCLLLEKLKWFDYGAELPLAVREILEDFETYQAERRSTQDIMKLWIQGISALMLVFALAFHVAEVGFIGLLIIVIQTAFNGITEEHQIGKAFEEALPFTSLLVVFFVIVAVIHDQHLFSPVISSVLAMDKSLQPGMFFIANGFLSAISDNVFVATVYINEVKAALDSGAIDQEHFNRLAIAINTGTNLPSVATPNGQAAFLFLLTSAIAPLVKLSYGKMVWMALPYTVVLSISGYFALVSFI